MSVSRRSTKAYLIAFLFRILFSKEREQAQFVDTTLRTGYSRMLLSNKVTPFDSVLRRVLDYRSVSGFNEYLSDSNVYRYLSCIKTKLQFKVKRDDTK